MALSLVRMNGSIIGTPPFAPNNIDSSASSGFSVAVKNRKTEMYKKIRLEITPAPAVVVRPEFQMVCERPPAAFGGSPPHGGGELSSHVAAVNLPLVRGRRERSERGGRSHTILNSPKTEFHF